MPPRRRCGNFPDETEDEHGAHAEFLDAYAYASFDVGERVLDLRVGSQVINWGEATFFSGINGMQNRFDASVANVPGTEVKEIFLPTGAVYAQIDLTSALALQTYYQYDWKHTILNGVGSYFSQQDYLGPGARQLLRRRARAVRPRSAASRASRTTSPATRASTAWRCATAWSRAPSWASTT